MRWHVAVCSFNYTLFYKLTIFVWETLQSYQHRNNDTFTNQRIQKEMNWEICPGVSIQYKHWRVTQTYTITIYTVSLCLNRETKIFSSAALTIRDQMFSVNIDLLLLKKIGNRFDLSLLDRYKFIWCPLTIIVQQLWERVSFQNKSQNNFPPCYFDELSGSIVVAKRSHRNRHGQPRRPQHPRYILLAREAHH